MSRMTASSTPGTPAPATGGATRRTSRVPLFTAEAWAPLKVELFRSLWIATSIAQIGTWAREAAGPSLMELLTEGQHNQPLMVGRVLAYSNLPICLFSVFAGALADVLDRRRLLIVTQVWMVLVSAVLGLLAIAGFITPWGLLGLTFLLGVGTAAFGPALQAVLPELVPRQHFALAINMNSVALNVARAVGPALFILVVQFVPGKRGAGVAYLLTALSFVASAWALWRWRRPPQSAGIHGEEMWGAIRAGWRYTVYSPANRAILLRVFTFIVPALVMWSQVPIIATRQLKLNMRPEEITALLFTFVGSGAVFGVFLMPGLHARYRIDPVVNVCTAFFGLGLIALAFTHYLWLAAIILIFLGMNWVIIPTNFNTATQLSVPPWVKGRAISFYLTVLFGSFTVGSLLWGRITTNTSIHTSLVLGGGSMLVLLTLAIWFPLTINEGKDLSPAYPEPPTERFGEKPLGTGPVRVGVRYRVPAHREQGFRDVMRDLRLIRLRNGAARWELEPVESAEGHTLLTERMTFSSWQEYTRSFSRATKGDLLLESLTREYHHGQEAPEAVAEEARRGFPILPLGRRPAEAGTTGSAPASAGFRLQDCIADALDRAIDEAFVAYDRFANAPRRRSAWRHVIIQFPATVLVRENGEAQLDRSPPTQSPAGFSTPESARPSSTGPG